MKTSEIHVGKTIGLWTVLAGPIRRKRVTYFSCECQCGTVRDVYAGSLATCSNSCGCLRSERLSEQRSTHGQNRKGARTRLYRVWAGMLQRCSNPKSNRYHLYGGRGISVCEAWRDFSAFAEWAASAGYNDTLQIDRVDCNQDYHPRNCRWVTATEQNRNKRSVRLVAAFGEAKTMPEWAADARCSVHRATIRHRLLVMGWPPERAISEPAAATA
jgi:hypothetical protein